MQRCRITFTAPGKVEITVDAEEEGKIEELLEDLSNGCAPFWLEELFLSGIKLEDIEVEDMTYVGREPEPEEELDFEAD